jgi:hypothetical protein
MKMKSEIFDSYVKQAKQDGWIDEGRIATDEDPRRGSDTLSDIEILYGVKPNGEEKPIVEQAHPEPCIIAPSYDKLNGLVENEQERQNIMVGIINKAPQAKLTQHKYAAEVLRDELVRIGFKMDNKKQESLAKMADSCLEKLSFFPALLLSPWLWAGVAGLYTVISQNINFSQGLRQDAEKAITEINEAVEDYPQLSKDVQPLLILINRVKNNCAKVADYMSQLIRNFPPESKDPKENAQTAAEFIKSNSDQDMLSILDSYKKDTERLMSIIPAHITNLKNRLQEYDSTGSDFLELGKRLFRYVVPTDMEDAWEALETLMESLSKEPSKAEAMIAQINSLRHQTSQLPEGNSFMDQMPKTPKPAPFAAPKLQPQETLVKQPADEVDELNKALEV